MRVVYHQLLAPLDVVGTTGGDSEGCEVGSGDGGGGSAVAADRWGQQQQQQQ